MPTRKRRPSPQTAKVLATLAEQPKEWRYGYELALELGLQSGSLYPILVRLSERRLLESRWETELASGRPPRHLYRLTGLGLDYHAAHAQASSARASARRRPELSGAS